MRSLSHSFTFTPSNTYSNLLYSTSKTNNWFSRIW